MILSTVVDNLLYKCDGDVNDLNCDQPFDARVKQ